MANRDERRKRTEKFVRALYRVLGLQDRHVRKLVLTIDMHGPIEMVVTEIVKEADDLTRIEELETVEVLRPESDE
jgi:hypothetical protein